MSGEDFIVVVFVVKVFIVVGVFMFIFVFIMIIVIREEVFMFLFIKFIQGVSFVIEFQEVFLKLVEDKKKDQLGLVFVCFGFW